MVILAVGMLIIDLMQRTQTTPPATRSQPDFFSFQVTEAQRFHLDLRPRRGVRLAVVCGGCERCAPDYQISRGDFPFLSLEYVAQGAGQLRLGRRQHALVPGTLFSYGPGIAQTIRNDPRCCLVKYFVDFVGTEAERLLRAGPLGVGGVRQTAAPSEVLAIFEELIRSGARTSPYTPALCAAVLEQLLLKVCETAIPAGAADTRAFASYQRCRQYIQAHHLRLRTLEQLARECHVDAAYLCRLFKRFDHYSPYQYLLRLKMQAAAERLQAADRLVKEIADDMGFADAFHFSRCFKSVFGVAPTRFALHQARVGEQ